MIEKKHRISKKKNTEYQKKHRILKKHRISKKRGIKMNKDINDMIMSMINDYQDVEKEVDEITISYKDKSISILPDYDMFTLIKFLRDYDRTAFFNENGNLIYRVGENEIEELFITITDINSMIQDIKIDRQILQLEERIKRLENMKK